MMMKALLLRPHGLTLVTTFLLAALLYPILAADVTTPPTSKLPNILLLLTDDQDAIVGGMAHMPKLERLLQQRGVTFQHGFVHTPICCPSRSSIVSGRYLHNGGALNNTVQGNCNGAQWQQDAEQTTFATVLKKAGYKTSYAGKYLNLYGRPGSPGCHAKDDEGCKRVPPGWDRWLGLRGNSQYYNYGVIRKEGENSEAQFGDHGQDYDKDYFPDLVANFTLESIKEYTKAQQPFVAVAAWPTAHMPFTPAPWAEHKFDGATVLKTPNYNASAESLQSKHWMMRWLAPIDPKTEEWMNEVYQNRTEALQSVDNHIEMFVNALQDANALDNTWIIYTSDNGWQLGQHRLSYDKRQLYENDIRVPFIVTGPGVPANVTSDKIVLNVDIAPTMADIAGQAKEEGVVNMDGTSFLPAIFGKTDGTDFRKDFLVSYHGRGSAQCGNFWNCPPPKPKDYHMGDWSNNTYHCVRTIISNEENTIYCRFLDDENFVEYYNIAEDEWQMHNAIHELSVEQRVNYEKRLEELRICKGKTCREEGSGTGTTKTTPIDVEVEIS